jgi:hypothetical protein
MLTVACVFSCAAVAAFPIPGAAPAALPPRPAAVGLLAPGSSSTAAAVTTDGRVPHPQPDGRRREVATALAFAAGLTLIGWLFAEGELSLPEIGRRRRRRFFEAAQTTKETES